MIKSKFRFRSVYLPLFVLFFFTLVGAFAVVLPDIVFRDVPVNARPGLVALIFAGGGGFLLVTLIQRMVVVRIFADRIELRGLFFRQTMHAGDITGIDLTARENIGLISAWRETGATVIRWGRSDRYVMPDSFYSNAPLLKQAMQENFLSAGKGEVFPDYASGGEPISASEDERAVAVTGNPYLNVHAVIFLVFIITMIVALRPLRADVGAVWYAIVLLLLLLPAYFLMGYRFFYFKLSADYLIVRNHFFPWYMKGYKKKDISGVVFENPYRRANSLRVNTTGFYSRRFAAGSLRREDWKTLEGMLKGAGVAVRDELPK